MLNNQELVKRQASRSPRVRLEKRLVHTAQVWGGDAFYEKKKRDVGRMQVQEGGTQTNTRTCCRDQQGSAWKRALPGKPKDSRSDCILARSNTAVKAIL